MQEFFAALALLAFLIVAPTASRAEGPCTRKPGVTVKMSGVDLDEMRCALSTYQQLLTNATATNANLLVQIQLLQADLTAAKDEAKKAAEPKPTDKPAEPPAK